jgi:hypothetical protein
MGKKLPTIKEGLRIKQGQQNIPNLPPSRSFQDTDKLTYYAYPS